MAIYTVTTNAKQEIALQKLLDAANISERMGDVTLTKADLIERYALGPVRDMVRQIRYAQQQQISDSYDVADTVTQDQIKALLNIT